MSDATNPELKYIREDLYLTKCEELAAAKAHHADALKMYNELYPLHAKAQECIKHLEAELKEKNDINSPWLVPPLLKTQQLLIESLQARQAALVECLNRVTSQDRLRGYPTGSEWRELIQLVGAAIKEHKGLA